MNPIDKLTTFLVATALIMIFTYWKTITSKQISKDHKTMIYVVTFLLPIIGLILCFVYETKDGQTKS